MLSKGKVNSICTLFPAGNKKLPAPLNSFKPSANFAIFEFCCPIRQGCKIFSKPSTCPFRPFLSHVRAELPFAHQTKVAIFWLYTQCFTDLFELKDILPVLLYRGSSACTIYLPFPFSKKYLSQNACRFGCNLGK